MASTEVDGCISHCSLKDVMKVTPEIIKKAAGKLKPGKSDPVYNFSSDCIKVDSECLAELLFIIIRCYLIHGQWSCYQVLTIGNPCAHPQGQLRQH